MAPKLNIGHKAKARLAPLRLSIRAADSDEGNPCPPADSGADRPIQPPSTKERHASLNPGGIVTAPSFHRALCSSPDLLSGANSPSASAAAPSSTASTKSAS